MQIDQIRKQLKNIQKYYHTHSVGNPSELLDSFKSYLFPSINRLDKLYDTYQTHIGNITINYARVGSGPPLVFVHGLSNNWEGWIPIIPYLKNKYTMYLIDLPGYGNSSPIRKYTARSLANIITRFVRTLPKKPITIIGASMGSIVVSEMFNKNPKLAPSKILIGPVIKNKRTLTLGYLTFKNFLLTMDRTEFSSSLLKKIIATKLGNYFTNKFINMHHFDRELSDTYTLVGKKKMTKEAYIQMGIASVSYPLHSILKRTKTPTLLIYGEKDKISSPNETRRSLLSQNSNLKIAEVEEAGHIVSLEKPKETAAAIDAFLQNNNLNS